MKTLIFFFLLTVMNGQLKYTLGLHSDLNQNYWNNQNQLAGVLSFGISNKDFASKFNVQINREAVFHIGLDDFFIKDENGFIIPYVNPRDTMSNSLPPNIYKINHFANMELQFYPGENIRLFSEIDFFKEENRLTEVYQIENIGIVDVVDKSKISVNADFGFEFYNDNIGFGLGIRNAKLYGNQSQKLTYTQQFKKSAFFMANLKFKHFTSHNSYNENEESYSLGIRIHEFIDVKPMNFNINLKTLGNIYRNKFLDTRLTYHFNETAKYHFGYRRMLKHNKTHYVNEFSKFFSESSIETFFISDQIKVGVDINLSSVKPNPFYIKNINLEDAEIFQVKAQYYLNNPIGFVEIGNRDDSEHKFRFKMSSEDNSILYTSNEYKIEGKQSIVIPVFATMTVLDQENLIEEKNVNFQALYDDNEYLLNSFKMSVYNRSSWNGDFKDLAYFIKSDNPITKRYAREKYRLAMMKSETQSITGQYTVLKQFINDIGKEFKYINDPVTTYRVDQVQRVEETLENQSGDCEDLVTFLSSLLSNVGYESTLISILPENREKEIGHVFLIINTNISASYQNELNLNDFNSMVRKNMYQQNTIWIPFEVTVFDQGFEKAHQEGARQYYEEVIEKDGLKKGKVIITSIEEY